MLRRFMTASATAFLVASTLAAQTANGVGANQLTVNGIGAGGISCIAVTTSQAQGLTLSTSAVPLAPFIFAIANTCTPGAIPISPGYFLDIDAASLTFVLDGTGSLIPANALTPFLTTGYSGQSTIQIPNAPTAPLSLQYGFVSAAFATGIGTSAAFRCRSFLQGLCTGPNDTPVTLGDDDTTSVSTPPFTLYGTTFSNFFINSNGSVSFGLGAPGFSESIGTFLAGPRRIAMWWDDLDPSAGGQIFHYSNGTNQAGACFVGVPEYGAPPATNQNTFEILFSNNDIIISYGVMTSTDGLVGISPGGNLDPTGTVINWSFPVSSGFGGTMTAYYELFDGTHPRDFGFGFTRMINLNGSGFPVSP